jgi:hypothetical protein
MLPEQCSAQAETSVSQTRLSFGPIKRIAFGRSSLFFAQFGVYDVVACPVDSGTMKFQFKLTWHSYSIATRLSVYMGAAAYLAACAHVVVNNIGLLPNSILHQMFDLGYEGNMPTWLNSIFWLSTAVAATLCFAFEKGKKFRWPWLLIACVFCFASCDEVAEIHENVGTALQELFEDNNLRQLSEASPGSPWIGFYLPVLAVVVIGMVVFIFKRLSLRGRLTVLGGFACFALAILMDFYQGMPDAERIVIATALGFQRSVLVELSILIEEVSELSGCICLTNAFVDHFCRLVEAQRALPSENT